MAATGKPTNEDKLVMIGYAAISAAYLILFLLKYKHLKESK